MARRSILKGIAAGIAQKFIARYNEIDGYWALGKLYLIASNNGSKELTLTLLNAQNTNPEWAQKVVNRFRRYLLVRLKQEGISRSKIKYATINLSFGIANGDEWLQIFKPWGERFSCRVTIMSDLGREYEFTVRGWCGKHDPKRESQSAQIS